ncbi:MAG: L-ribulose-5-phosphate 4-epimerase [Clostridia bacterium]
MLQTLKEAVWRANGLLPAYQLVTLTWGNVSGFDAASGLFVIKPSGVPYAELTPADMVVVDLEGHTVEGTRKPSSDTATHAVLYRKMEGIGGIVHTHSRWATIWSQAGRNIPVYGTTHADAVFGEVPCTRLLTEQEVAGAYEAETGNVIAAHFEAHHLSPAQVPCVLVQGHGPFAWGKDAEAAVEKAVVLEEIAMMAWQTEMLCASAPRQALPHYLLEKHFLRKHGPGAYYGQG